MYLQKLLKHLSNPIISNMTVIFTLSAEPSKNCGLNLTRFLLLNRCTSIYVADVGIAAIRKHRKLLYIGFTEKGRTKIIPCEG